MMNDEMMNDDEFILFPIFLLTYIATILGAIMEENYEGF